MYQFVITDLLESGLPEATALLARVYLQQGDYPNARDAANAAINSSGATLTATYAGAFNNAENSTEDIFAWQITVQDGVNDYNTFWATQEFGGRRPDADVNILDSFFDIFDDPNDERSTFFYEGSNTLSTLKWQNQFANVPFIRLAEMYLIRAESNFRENTTVGAAPIADVNRLRARARATLFIALTLDDILDERKRELAFESFTLHDLKRLQESIVIRENSNNVELSYDSDRLILPIPQRELDANPELEPNP